MITNHLHIYPFVRNRPKNVGFGDDTEKKNWTLHENNENRSDDKKPRQPQINAYRIPVNGGQRVGFFLFYLLWNILKCVSESEILKKKFFRAHTQNDAKKGKP